MLAPPVRILSRRFLASYLSLFAITLAIMTTIAIIFETLVDFDKIVEHQNAAGGVFPYLVLRIPSLYLRDLIPSPPLPRPFCAWAEQRVPTRSRRPKRAGSRRSVWPCP